MHAVFRAAITHIDAVLLGVFEASQLWQWHVKIFAKLEFGLIENRAAQNGVAINSLFSNINGTPNSAQTVFNKGTGDSASSQELRAAAIQNNRRD